MLDFSQVSLEKVEYTTTVLNYCKSIILKNKLTT